MMTLFILVVVQYLLIFCLFVLLNYDKNDIFCCLVGVPFLHLVSVCPVCLSMQINFRGMQYY